MTDPLLTIEDATREFRVSPKTIRRRLSGGEIDGAYKRPGSRGPEWVMPRGSLVAAGFVERPGTTGLVSVPEDDRRRADYWEQRAKDAEVALAAQSRDSDAGEAADRGAGRRATGLLAVLFTAATVAIAVLAAALVLVGGDDDPSAGSSDPMEGTRGVLAALTDPGDPVGFAGPIRTDVLPPQRRAVAVTGAAADSPRYVVAVFEGDDPGPDVAELAERSTTVLRLARSDGWVMVLDTGPAPASEPGGAPDDEVVAPPLAGEERNDGTPAPPDPAPAAPVDDPPPAAPEAPQDGGAPAPAAPPTDDGVQAPVEDVATAPDGGDAGPASSPASVEVQDGDSFWTIAEDLAGAPGGATVAQVTQVWAELIDANADRLVDPGNPDLLHVGQTLVVPSP